MPVVQVHEALGTFEFEILANVPREVLDGIRHFDHIAVIPGRMDPRQYGDNTLTAARYVGVVRKLKYADDGRTNLIQDDIRIEGVGMEFWLGDDDGKGAVIETLTDFTAQTFTTVMNALRPAAVGAGTIYSVSGSYTGRHQYETPRNAIQYVCQTMSTELIPVGYKVSNDSKLYAGPESSLYVTDPVCIIMRKGGTQGEDMFMRALPSTVDMDEDMEDFSTRVLMLAEADGESLTTGSADIADVAPGVNVYKDLYGNPLVLTRLVSESETLVENADTRAELALRDVIEPHRAITLATDDYDVHGTFEVGDYIYVYDPDAGLVDLDNEVYIRGVRVNPLKLRVKEADWAITDSFTVAHRDKDGNWTDLTDYVHWEEQQTTRVVVGDYNRDLTGSKQTIVDRTGSVNAPDLSIPGEVSWVVASFQTTNYADEQGISKARQKLVWDTPLNTDLTAIADGSHYEIQYKLDTGSLYSQTWSAASTLTWTTMNTWDQPVEPDDVEWQTLNAPWGDNSLVIHELPVGTGFDYRIRAVDRGNNQGVWSDIETVVTSEDNIPPSPPAAPTVAASTIAIQVIHTLGKASGGTYNLEKDLAQLEVHYSSDEGFFPSDVTLAGRMRADNGMMSAGTAAIATFPVSQTNEIYVKVVAVDRGGNRSNASAPAPVTAELLDSQYISELTATKISAGTLGSNVILAASIKTAETGQRVELNQSGLQAYDQDGELTINLTANPSGGDYLTLRGPDGNPAASIADTGDASFTNVYTDNAVFIGGEDIVEDIIRPLPTGIIAVNNSPNNSGNYDGTNQLLWNRIVIPDFSGSRVYRVGSKAHINLQGIGVNLVRQRVRYAWDTPTSAGSTELVTTQIDRSTTALFDNTIECDFPFSFTSPGGTDLHLGFYLDAGSTAGFRYEGKNYGRAWIEDCGPTVLEGSFDATGSGSSTPPVQNYTKYYNATWTSSYYSSGNKRNDNSDMYQGFYSSNNGNQRSLMGFNYSQIQSDLSGATITAVYLTAKNTHFYYNSGGTAVFGSHNYTSSPSTWNTNNVTEGRNSFSWAYGATKTVSLGVAYGNEFKSGACRGIALGPGSSNALDYYGYFVGGSNPYLRIDYTK